MSGWQWPVLSHLSQGKGLWGRWEMMRARMCNEHLHTSHIMPVKLQNVPGFRQISLHQDEGRGVREILEYRCNNPGGTGSCVIAVSGVKAQSHRLSSAFWLITRQRSTTVVNHLSAWEQETQHERFPVCCLELKPRDKQFPEVHRNLQWLCIVLHVSVQEQWRSNCFLSAFSNHQCWNECPRVENAALEPPASHAFTEFQFCYDKALTIHHHHGQSAFIRSSWVLAMIYNIVPSHWHIIQ